MIKHGDKLGKNLYFCMYPITLKTYKELGKLARAAGAYFSFMRDFELNAQALGCTKEEATLRLDKSGLNDLPKYKGSGAMALLQVFKSFENNVFIGETDENSCYLACFSCKKPGDTFNFIKDAANIEMMMSVSTAPHLDYVIHLGIQRSLCYALNNHPTHANISMLLHGSAAAFMMQRNPNKKFMVTLPLKSMEKIFIHNLKPEDILTVSNYNLNPLRKKLEIPSGDPLRILNIGDLVGNKHFAVSLDALSTFSKEPILDLSKQPEKISNSSYLNWLLSHPALLMGGVGLLIAAGVIINSSHDNLEDRINYFLDFSRPVTFYGNKFFKALVGSDYQDVPEDSSLTI